MKHTPSKVIVYTTTDYSRFKKVDGNRGLNKSKIDKIITEIKAGNDILDDVPVLVVDKKTFLDVQDGQHRIEIAKKLGRAVNYIIHKKGMSLYDIAKVNSNVEKWTAANFIECYSKAGNENYIQLKKFHEKYGISAGVCLTMLTFGAGKAGGGSQKTLTQQFEKGMFVVKKYKEAVHLAEVCKAFETFPGWNSRGFIAAITQILQADKCDFSILTKKFNQYPKRLIMQSNWKGYLSNLEDIYNIDNSKRRVIY